MAKSTLLGSAERNKPRLTIKKRKPAKRVIKPIAESTAANAETVVTVTVTEKTIKPPKVSQAWLKEHTHLYRKIRYRIKIYPRQQINHVTKIVQHL